MEFLVSSAGIITGSVSIPVGLIIIFWPRLIAYIIAGYLVLVGIIMLLASL